MADIFTREWIESFANKWNADNEMVVPLFTHGFSAVIALGYAAHEDPSVLIEVENGRVARAGLYHAATTPTVDWDLRATPAQWAAWKKKPLEIMGVSVAVNSGQLQFKAGDYRKLMRTPDLAKAFLRFFTLL
jgi:hypothetical protein